jgi:hypothetical protein
LITAQEVSGLNPDKVTNKPKGIKRTTISLSRFFYAF